jgi:hypothetical protein
MFILTYVYGVLQVFLPILVGAVFGLGGEV